ncbi:MAG: metal-dependent hydrolase [Hyphomicrobium sp.]
MANFATHLSVGTLSSGLLASITSSLGVIPSEDLIPLTMVGIIGSILPDIDLKESRPSQVLFSTLGFFFSLVILYASAKKYSISELWILWLGSLVFIRYGTQALFHNFTVHRGIWHSILSAVFFSLLVAVFVHFFLDYSEFLAWTSALFLFIGYIIHLLLDEIYSVDFMGGYTKRSFGTALKLYDTRNLLSGFYMLCGIAFLISIAPNHEGFFKYLFSSDTWIHLTKNILPQGKWFGVVDLKTLLTF